MSHLLKAILARDKASTAVYYAQRTYDSAHDANEKAQKQLTRHQDSADRRVRIKYAQRATGLLDALDEAREALEAAMQAAELARQKEAYFGQRG